MRVVLSSIGRAAVLALVSCGAAQAQSFVDTVSGITQASGTVGTVAYAKDKLPTGSALSSTSTTFRGFDADLGVLVGASLSLNLDNAGQGLMLRTMSSENTAKGLAGSFTGNLQVFSGDPKALIAASGSTTLISYSAAGVDVTTAVDVGQWSQTSLTAASTDARALNGLVGVDRLVTSQLDTQLLVSNEPKNKNTVAQTYLTYGTAAAVATFTGTADYSYLAHGSAATMFDNVADTEVYLSNGRRTARLTVVAGGSADSTTGVDFSGLSADVSCTGMCNRFQLNLNAFSLAAGEQIDLGQVSLLGQEDNFTATYTLTLRDSAGVGASASHRTTVMSFVLESGVVSTVPETQTYAMLLAGLGFMGMTARRRRAGGQVQSR